jgi:hypothetical protein
LLKQICTNKIKNQIFVTNPTIEDFQ